MSQFPKLINLKSKKQYRIIPSVYPPINFFEEIVKPEEMEMLWEIESLTNERLLAEVGDIFLVPKEDRVCGPGSSVVMAAFTHVGRPSRFTNGDYGIYYASLSYETAIRETVYHRERFLQATQQQAMEITMRCYRGEILKPLHNVQENRFKQLHAHNDYTVSQKYAREIRDAKSWGLFYHSVRHERGQCIAIFRPPAISIPTPLSHLRYVWDGRKIVEVLDTQSLMQM